MSGSLCFVTYTNNVKFIQLAANWHTNKVSSQVCCLFVQAARLIIAVQQVAWPFFSQANLGLCPAPTPSPPITAPPLTQTQLNDLLIQGNLHITCKLLRHYGIIQQWWAAPKKPEDAAHRRLNSMLDQRLIPTLIKLNLLCNNYYFSQGLGKVGGSMNPETHDRAPALSLVWS